MEADSRLATYADAPMIEPAVTQDELARVLSSLYQVKWQITDDTVVFQSFVGPVCVSTITLPAAAFMQIAKDFAVKQKHLEDVRRAAQQVLKTKL
jgi:hypothetical protein